MAGKMKVVFVCFHNSARSQMAEGLLRAMYVDRYEVYSAGVKASQVDPRAVKVMNEIGIDISKQRSKNVDEYRGTLFDLAVTVCDKAREMCPICGVSLNAPANAPVSRKNNPQDLHRSCYRRWVGRRSANYFPACKRRDQGVDHTKLLNCMYV